MRLPGTRRRPRSGRPLFPPLVGLAPLALVLLLWQLFGDPDSVNFPPPGEWVEATKAVQDRDLLLPALEQTLAVFAVALVLAAVIGAAAGTLLGASAFARDAFGPVAEFLRNFPPPAAVPVAVLLLGDTLTMSLIVIVGTAVWPIILNTEEAVRAIPHVRINAGRALGLSRPRQITTLIVPGVLPAVMIGVRVATPICLIVVLLAEMLASTGGVGHLILERQRMYDSAGVFACLAIVGVLGLLTSATVGGLERVMLRNWPPSHAEGKST
ncbi:ABC transporter permease [Actinocorallia sp. A-T 12471]|uniref:ABC transporter permease n=1 Tax=Actinocorallia sp. A-T 12471 TaxID=3089813 RepID=UPI0029D18903|nr:ABC transporter permease subunit [Actinocorallia sp. A-T 12471]MDX6744183.1 ABC transporter permease subunit [Actinocorallia sp. A-T 12471]